MRAKSLKTYGFEGRQRTMHEILGMVPAIKSDATIKRHLEEGRDTVQKMMAFNARDKAIAATRKSYQKRGRPSMDAQRFGYSPEQGK